VLQESTIYAENRKPLQPIILGMVNGQTHLTNRL